MTDKEIIKSLKCCRDTLASQQPAACDECPYNERYN